MGIKAFGFSSGFAVNVGNDDPGPHRMIAWKPGAGIASACGIFASSFSQRLAIGESVVLVPETSLKGLGTVLCSKVIVCPIRRRGW